MLRTVVIALAFAGCASASEGDPGVDAPRGSGGVDAPAGGDAPQATPCDLALTGLASDFEGGASGWTHVVLDGAQGQATWPFDEWQHGAATSGPNSCHGGTGCWGTRLDANYTSCQRAALVSPSLDLSVCAGQTVELTIWSWHDFWTGVVSGSSTTWYDGGLIEVSNDGSSWSEVTTAYPGRIDINPNIGQNECVLSDAFHVDGKAGLVGASAGWQQLAVTIPATFVTATMRVRFAYGSGVSFANNDPEVDRQHTRPGWYLDDLAFARR